MFNKNKRIVALEDRIDNIVSTLSFNRKEICDLKANIGLLIGMFKPLTLAGIKNGVRILGYSQYNETLKYFWIFERDGKSAIYEIL